MSSCLTIAIGENRWFPDGYCALELRIIHERTIIDIAELVVIESFTTDALLVYFNMKINQKRYKLALLQKFQHLHKLNLFKLIIGDVTVKYLLNSRSKLH